MPWRVPTAMLVLAALFGVAAAVSVAAPSAPAAVKGKTKPAKERSKHLWATVNLCDDPSAPNVVGVRASMPGNGTRQVMYMHFTAEWYSSAENRWVPTGSTSPWVRVGSARFVATQAGFSFQFGDPPPGVGYLMRGVVRYQWRARLGGRVMMRRTRVTAAGYPNVAGGVPAGRSDADCMVAP